MNISVLIGSCDNYSFLWENFDILFKRYWSLNTKNYLISETKSFDNKDYITLTPGKLPWGQRILEGLNLIDTEYVLFILDDYYLSENFDENLINEHINLLKEHSGEKIMMDIDYGEPIYSLDHLSNNLYKFKENSDYLNSVQPAIWRTDYLRKVLKPEYSPWDFELIGNNFTKTINPTILLNKRESHMYFNFTRIGGKLSEGWEEFLKKQNLI
jgi:hypothetical protein